MSAIQKFFSNRALKQRVIAQTGVSFTELDRYLNRTPSPTGKPLIVKTGVGGKQRVGRHETSRLSRLAHYLAGKKSIRQTGKQQLFFDQAGEGVRWLRQFDASPGVAYAVKQLQTRSPSVLNDTDEFRRYVKILAAAERNLTDKTEVIAGTVAEMKLVRQELLNQGDTIKKEYPSWDREQNMAKLLNKRMVTRVDKNEAMISGEARIRSFIQKAGQELGLTSIQLLEKVLLNSAVPYGLQSDTHDAMVSLYEELRLSALFVAPEVIQVEPVKQPARQVRFESTPTVHEYVGVTREARTQPSYASQTLDLARTQQMALNSAYSQQAITMASAVVKEYREGRGPERPPAVQLAKLANEYSDIQLNVETDQLAMKTGSSELDYLYQVLGSTPVLLMLNEEERAELLHSLDQAFGVQDKPV